MMTVETKITVYATERDIEPLQNFLGWLEDMDCDVYDACESLLPSEQSLSRIYEDLRALLDNIEVN